MPPACSPVTRPGSGRCPAAPGRFARGGEDTTAGQPPRRALPWPEAGGREDEMTGLSACAAQPGREEDGILADFARNAGRPARD
jgi:hypothetical protein